MADRVNDGGPAFPVGLGTQPDQYVSGTGMSLRDYFAAAALTGLLASGEYAETAYHDTASDAFDIADAMLADRGERE